MIRRCAFVCGPLLVAFSYVWADSHRVVFCLTGDLGLLPSDQRAEYEAFKRSERPSVSFRYASEFTYVLSVAGRVTISTNGRSAQQIKMYRLSAPGVIKLEPGAQLELENADGSSGTAFGNIHGTWIVLLDDRVKYPCDSEQPDN